MDPDLKIKTLENEKLNSRFTLIGPLSNNISFSIFRCSLNSIDLFVKIHDYQEISSFIRQLRLMDFSGYIEKKEHLTMDSFTDSRWLLLPFDDQIHLSWFSYWQNQGNLTYNPTGRNKGNVNSVTFLINWHLLRSYL